MIRGNVGDKDGIGVPCDIDSDKSGICDSHRAGFYSQRVAEATDLLVRKACRQDCYVIVRERENSDVRIPENVRENDRHYSFSLTRKQDDFACFLFDPANPNLSRGFADSPIPQETVCLLT